MGVDSTSVADEGLRSKPDTEQLKFAADNNHVFVTADTRIKIRKHERAALQSAGVKVIEINFPKSYELWDCFTMLVDKWPEIERRLQSEDYVVVRARSVKSLKEDSRK